MANRRNYLPDMGSHFRSCHRWKALSNHVITLSLTHAPFDCTCLADYGTLLRGARSTMQGLQQVEYVVFLVEQQGSWIYLNRKKTNTVWLHLKVWCAAGDDWCRTRTPISWHSDTCALAGFPLPLVSTAILLSCRDNADSPSPHPSAARTLGETGFRPYPWNRLESNHVAG